MGLLWSSWESFRWTLRIHGQYVLLQTFKITNRIPYHRWGTGCVHHWTGDIDWALSLLIHLLTQMVGSESVFDLIEAYVSQISVDTGKQLAAKFDTLVLEQAGEVSTVVKDLLLIPNVSDATLTKRRFDLGADLIGTLPSEIFVQHLDVVVLLILNRLERLRSFGEALVEENLSQDGDAFRTRLGML